MIGSSISRGRLPLTRETRSRTSFAASSTLRFNSNSIVMTDPSSLLDEDIVFTPWRVANCSSRMLVISVSTTLGLAPRYVVTTEMIGGSMSGYSRTGSRRNEMTPNRRIVTLITVANTGRRMDMVLSFMRVVPSLDGGIGNGGHRNDL